MTNPLTSGHMKTRYLLRATPQAVVSQIENLTSRLPQEWMRRLFTQIAARFRKPN